MKDTALRKRLERFGLTLEPTKTKLVEFGRYAQRHAGKISRYAADTVVGFEHESDARRFWDAMRERLQEFALSLHPDKTRLSEFGRQAAVRRAQREVGKPETFNFLGFTLICGKSRRGDVAPDFHPGLT